MAKYRIDVAKVEIPDGKTCNYIWTIRQYGRGLSFPMNIRGFKVKKFKN